jgi:GGDEF domain-containing protein
LYTTLILLHRDDKAVVMLPEVPSPAHVSDRQQAALTCYLSVMLAMARSMRAVCSRAGLIYGDRLTRLPRRLGFEATPEALEESRQMLEAELAEYTEATSAWLDDGSNLAREIVAIIGGLERGASESQNLHAAMLEDLAEQMAASAEVDTASDVRVALKRYAMGLRSYLQRRQMESHASLKDLQCRAEQLAEWLARADPSHSTDPVTGLPNRAETERQLEACWYAGKPVSVLVFEWKEPVPATAAGAAQVIAKQVADRLADLVRPRDIVGRWGPNQFAVIFACPASEAMQRAGSIAEWLTTGYSALLDGVIANIQVCVTVTVIERRPMETLSDLVLRIEELQPEPATSRSA